MTSHRENKVLSYALNVFLSAFTPYFLFLLFFVFLPQRSSSTPPSPLPAAGTTAFATTLRLPSDKPDNFSLRQPNNYLRPTTYDPRLNNYQLLFGLPASTYQRPTEKVIEPKGNAQKKGRH
ncbi:hypothetical protein QOT17_011568 [Balamuthia mandrillaris]